MAVTEFIGSFAWIIQSAIMIMIIVEIIRLFGSFKKSNSEKDDESFMQNIKSLFGKNEEKIKQKEEEARKKELEAKEAEKKIEEMGRGIGQLGIDARNNVGVLEEGYKKLVEVESNPNFYSITKDVSDKVVEVMLVASEKVKEDLDKIKKVEMGPINENMNIISSRVKDIEEKFEENIKQIEEEIEKLKSNTKISAKEKDSIKKSLSEKITKVTEKVNNLKEIVRKAEKEIKTFESNIRVDIVLENKIIQAARNINNDLKVIKNALENISKNNDAKSRGIAKGEYSRKLSSLKGDVDIIKKAMDDLTTKLDGEINNISKKLVEYLNNINKELIEMETIINAKIS